MSEQNLIHLKAPGCWINDPNGFIYFQGMYHLFYQCFPYSTQWGRMHWGHAVSRDLVTWEHKGIALYPTKINDRSGCFSGSAVEHNGKLYLFYTGVNYTEEDPDNINCCINDTFTAAQMRITSEDGFHFDNIRDKITVIPPIEDQSIGCKNHTRDPKVWRGKDAWYMILGSTAEKEGRVLLYRSGDLEHWTFQSFAEHHGWGWGWECPDYFEVENQGVLIFSPMEFLKTEKLYRAVAICTLAQFDETVCEMKIPDSYQMLDYGLDLYAPQSTIDAQGRRIVIAWARMPEAVEGKWNGMFCMPRVVEVKGDHVYFRPHPDVAGRFTRPIQDPSEAGKGGYLLRTELSEGEVFSIGGYALQYRDGKFCADRSAVFAGHDEIQCRFETPRLHNGCHLAIYVDSNLIEVYVNDGEYVLTNVVYGLSNEIRGDRYVLFAIED